MTIKVRFAPSPTGFLHLGNARMACLNYFLAKSKNGEFILRIDDTDTKRIKQEYIDALSNDLKWLGISWQTEFKQSEKIERYNQAIQELKAKGKVYECFETIEELEYKKKLQLAKGKPPIYDRSMLKLTLEEKQKYLEEGRKPHLRFKISHKEIKWQDIIKGEIIFNGENLSDPVVAREDGSFLYSLISVIDDIDTNITHIIRGEDHISNTASQIQMFEELGGNIPLFAHLPLITNTQGQGFSKRENSLSLQGLRKEGILPITINNYLYSIGLSEDNTMYNSIEDIIKNFDLNKYNKSSAKFDESKLLKLNLSFLQQENFESIANLTKEYLNIEIFQDFWEKIKFNIEKLSDISLWHNICYNKDFKSSTNNKDLIKIALDTIPEGTWNEDTWSLWLNSIKEKSSLKNKEIFKPLRIAFSSLEKGPEFKDLILLIGKDNLQIRLQRLI